MPFFSRVKNIGIDISDFSVEVLALDSRKRIVAYGRDFLPEGVVSEGEIKKPAQLAEILKRIIERNKALKGKKLSASFVFPKTKTFLSHFEYPASSSQEDISERVRSEVLSFFSDSLNSIVWDFAPVENNGSKSKTKQNGKKGMLYAVAGKSVVDGYIETAKFLNLENFSIEIEPILLRRALLAQVSENSSYLVIDIGANASSFYIFTPGEEIEYTSNVKVGGAKITSEISAKKGVSIEDAEKLKKEKGLLDQEIGQIIIDTIVPIKDTVSWLIEKHEKTSGKELDKIILIGGGSLLKGTDSYFEKLFSKEVVLGNPLLGLRGDNVFPAEINPVLFTNVIGSGLKHIHKSPIKNIDFTPKRYEEKNSNIKIIQAILLVVFIIIVITFTVYTSFNPLF